MSDCNGCDEEKKELISKLVFTQTQLAEWKKSAIHWSEEAGKFQKKNISLLSRVADLAEQLENREIELESFKAHIRSLEEENGS